MVPAWNLKSEEAYRLVKEVADRRSTSLTATVVQLAREEFKRPPPRRRNPGWAQYWLDVVADVGCGLDEETLVAARDVGMYDDDGLPT